MNKKIATFQDVMDTFPFSDLWTLLNNPQPIDEVTFQCVINWCRPKRVQTEIFVWEACIESGLLNSKSEVNRKIKENSLKWNGEKVKDPEERVSFLQPGWGVLQLGKKLHKVVISDNWVVGQFEEK